VSSSFFYTTRSCVAGDQGLIVSERAHHQRADGVTRLIFAGLSEMVNEDPQIARRDALVSDAGFRTFSHNE